MPNLISVQFKNMILCNFSHEFIINLVSFNLHGTPNFLGAAACPGARGGPVRVHAPRDRHQQQVQGHREEFVDCPGREGECGLFVSRPASLRRRSKRDPCRGCAYCECDICRVVATASWILAQLPIPTTVSGTSKHVRAICGDRGPPKHLVVHGVQLALVLLCDLDHHRGCGCRLPHPRLVHWPVGEIRALLAQMGERDVHTLHPFCARCVCECGRRDPTSIAKI